MLLHLVLRERPSMNDETSTTVRHSLGEIQAMRERGEDQTSSDAPEAASLGAEFWSSDPQELRTPEFQSEKEEAEWWDSPEGRAVLLQGFRQAQQDGTLRRGTRNSSPPGAVKKVENAV